MRPQKQKTILALEALGRSACPDLSNEDLAKLAQAVKDAMGAEIKIDASNPRAFFAALAADVRNGNVELGDIGGLLSEAHFELKRRLS